MGMKLTDLLILLCISFSLYAWGGRSTDLAFNAHAFFSGSYHTVITGLFVHGDLFHLTGNMIFLYIFGSSLEEDMGAGRTAAVFFTSGVLSFLLSIPFYPGAKMVGASAAIFALMAAVLLVRRPEFSLQFISPIGPLALLFLIFNIVAIHNGEKSNIAYISHVIGFVIGISFGIRWNEQWKKSLIYTLVLLIVYVILYNYLKMWFVLP